MIAKSDLIVDQHRQTPDCGYLPWNKCAGVEGRADHPLNIAECYHYEHLSGVCINEDNLTRCGQPCPYQGTPEKIL